MTDIVNIGTAPDDKTGDRLRDAFVKVNAELARLVPLNRCIMYTEPPLKDRYIGQLFFDGHLCVWDGHWWIQTTI